MQQENNQTKLEELDVLEGFVQLGCNLPYGPYTLFKRLARRYPLHFIQFMNKYWYQTRAEGTETLYRHLPIALADVDTLSQKLEYYLTHEPRSDGERKEFQRAVEGLENGLWRRNFSDPSYTHFLDIDQYTDDAEGLGVQSLFYHLDGPSLRIHLTGRDGNKLGAQSYPAQKGSIKAILSAFLLRYFSELGSHSGDNVYLWSPIISRKEFEALSGQGLEIKRQKRTVAERLAEHNELIIYCKEHHLWPRPEGSNETAWQARCPSGGKHTLMISTTSNQWGCGYCRKKGGLEELKQWVEAPRVLGR